VDNDQLTAYLYGDGTFLHKTAKSLRAVHTTYEAPAVSSAPAQCGYFSYQLDEIRKERYDDLKMCKLVDDTLFTQNNHSSGTVTRLKPFDPVVITSAVSPGDAIALCSGGIDSFEQDSEPLPWTYVATRIINVENAEYDFLRRNLLSFQKECALKNISHTKNLVVAAIVA
jgi:hypothetical protein